MRRILFLSMLMLILVLSVAAEAAQAVELKCVAFTCQDLQNPFFKLMGMLYARLPGILAAMASGCWWSLR